mgnify:CR=1 FL=1
MNRPTQSSGLEINSEPLESIVDGVDGQNWVQTKDHGGPLVEPSSVEASSSSNISSIVWTAAIPQAPQFLETWEAQIDVYCSANWDGLAAHSGTYADRCTASDFCVVADTLKTCTDACITRNNEVTTCTGVSYHKTEGYCVMMATSVDSDGCVDVQSDWNSYWRSSIPQDVGTSMYRMNVGKFGSTSGDGGIINTHVETNVKDLKAIAFYIKIESNHGSTIVDTCIKKNDGTDEQCAGYTSSDINCETGSRANKCLFVPAGTERTIVSKLIQGRVFDGMEITLINGKVRVYIGALTTTSNSCTVKTGGTNVNCARASANQDACDGESSSASTLSNKCVFSSNPLLVPQTGDNVPETGDNLAPIKYVESTDALELNTWVHVAVRIIATNSGGGIKLFIDGKVVATASPPQKFEDGVSGTRVALIPSDYTGGIILGNRAPDPADSK